jgi:hypothetical protein
MKKGIISLLLIATFASAETGNQVSISDLKEAIYKLIIMQEKMRVEQQKSNVQRTPYLQKDHLDNYIENYVEQNKRLLPKY